MSCLLQTAPGVPHHHLNQRQAYFLHQPTQPSIVFRHMQGQAEEPVTEESLLFQSLTTRSRMSHDTGQQEGSRRRTFNAEAKCHFTTCPPDCDNPGHVVVLGPVSLYTPTDQENIRENDPDDPSEPEARVMVKQEPYYDEYSAGMGRDPQVLYLETCPTAHTITPTPANSPVKLRPLAPQFGYNSTDFYDVETGVYHGGEGRHDGEQYTQFRSPTSPTESSVTSCSSSTLSLLSLMSSTPQRRHSFSATIPNSALLATMTPGNSHSTVASSTYRQRSYTYSNSSKSHPYSMPKRMSACNISAQNEQTREYQTLEGFRSLCSTTSSLSDDHEAHGFEHDHELDPEHEVRSISGGSDSQDSEGKKGPMEPNPCSFLFLGPVGKKRRMVRERQQSVGPESQGGDDASPEEDLSPASDSTQTSQPMKQEAEDIIAEEEEEDEDAQPLNLCLGEEDLERVKRLNINCVAGTSCHPPSPPQAQASNRNRIPLSPQLSGSVLRDHLLSLEMVSPTSRAGSMSSNSQSQPSPPWLGRAGAPESFSGSGVASCSTGSPQASGSGGNGKAKKKLKCPICAKEFSQLRNYRYHCSRHAGTDQFACTCPICHKVFNDKGYLGSHMKIHNNKKEYHCEWCEKRFNQRVAYNMHVRIHTGVKPHQCHLCTKAFSRKMLLRQHLRTHTGERPYSCEVCGKAFADRSNMLLHQRLHTGQRPYTCTYPKCGKSFSKNHHLKTHLNHHAGIKPYQCEKCLACFSQSSNMKTHFRKCTGTANSGNAAAAVGVASAAAGAPTMTQSHAGSMNNLASSSGTQAIPYNPRGRTNSLGRQGLTNTNYSNFGPYLGGSTSPEGSGVTEASAGGRRRSIPISESARNFEIRSNITSMATTIRASYPFDSSSQIQDYPNVPRTVHQSTASRLMYEQSRSIRFPDSLIPPTPLASSLPLNFELHTLRSRNPQLLQPLAGNPFMTGQQQGPRERYFESQSQQASWSSSANYRQSAFSPRKEGP